MKRKLVTLFVAVALLSNTLAGCTIGDTEIVWDTNSVGRNHVFSINGNRCTKEEARLYLCNYQNIYGYEYGVNLWEYDFSQMEEGQTLTDYVKAVTLSELSNIMCMQQLAKKQGIKLTEGEKKLVSKAADEYYKSLSKDEISYIGLDKSELKSFYERYALAKKLYRTLTEGINEEVSDDEARVIRIQQIYVKNEATAIQVKQKLSKGEKFDSLASTYNEAGIIEKNLARGELPEEVDAVAFRLDNDEESDMITTDKGYYFIKCLNKFDSELTEANKANIIVKRRKEQFEDKFVGFIEESKFDLNEEVWANIKIDTSGAIKTDSFFAVYEKYFEE